MDSGRETSGQGLRDGGAETPWVRGRRNSVWSRVDYCWVAALSFKLDFSAGDAGLASSFNLYIVDAGGGQGVEVHVELDPHELAWLPHGGRIDGQDIAGTLQGTAPDLSIMGLNQGEDCRRFTDDLICSQP